MVHLWLFRWFCQPVELGDEHAYLVDAREEHVVDAGAGAGRYLVEGQVVPRLELSQQFAIEISA